ncbi:MAG: hypothetical protein AAGE59_02095 [Cyanobacteria bacterium P01_F01_bin.86]
MRQPAVFFYLPPSLWPDDLPDNAVLNWSGFGLGIYAWTIQTYLRVREAGLRCALVDYLPEKGIVFLHRNGFRDHQQGIEMSPQRLLVCFQSDVLPHPDAQVHVVQNQTQENCQTHSYFMPHWPQPGLLSRQHDRGDRFDTVAFFGHATNLAPEFLGHQWVATLRELGLNWRPVINTNRWNEHHSLNTQWNDYRQVDAVVAVRSFDPIVLEQTKSYCYKPATKLYNAWLAGVPAILGPESGYRMERQTALDYLEVTAFDQVLPTLLRLKEDAALRQAMVGNGRMRSQTITPAYLTQRWLSFIQDTLFPLYDEWCSQSHWQQQLRSHYSHWRYHSQRLHQRLQAKQYSANRG